MPDSQKKPLYQRLVAGLVAAVLGGVISSWIPGEDKKIRLGSDQKNSTVQQWYEDHAHEFADADVIESAFIGMARESQERLNRFKLWAIGQGDLVDLKGKRVLEFGAGHGRFALAYPEVASYLGVDFSQNLVDLGNRRFAQAKMAERAKLVRGDVLSFSALQQFDVVCSLGMMCYFPDPVPVIAAMARFVEPGGSLFFDFRNDSLIYSAVRRVKWLLRPPTSGFAHALQSGSIGRELKRLGFQDIRFVSREFPLLAEHYAKSQSQWPLSLRNVLADSAIARPFATEAWVFARRP